MINLLFHEVRKKTLGLIDDCSAIYCVKQGKDHLLLWAVDTCIFSRLTGTTGNCNGSLNDDKKYVPSFD